MVSLRLKTLPIKELTSSAFGEVDVAQNLLPRWRNWGIH